MESRTFTVRAEDLPTRLDTFLARSCPDLTRSRIKKLIDEGLVRLNNSPAKAGASLADGSLVVIEIPELKEASTTPQEIPLDILYEDSQLLVLDKAPHMVVHPSHGHPDGTLVNAILHHCRDLSGIGGVTRPGIVHRLDKGTSGVMVVAKSDNAHQSLAGQFKDHSIGRIYLAACRGNVGEDKGRIEKPLGRHLKERKKIAVRNDGRRAVTDFTVLARRGNMSVVRLEPGTGRTHQLRVHLSSMGHPILGDPTYGGGIKTVHVRDREALTLLKQLKRPALHAHMLAFDHPDDGRRLEFTSPPPEDLAGLFDWIQGKR
jgi:23S rRNA pseudouridine1911/1915/1917 synthase